ncbi:uncharacterized protein L199_006416 [Kwoniella botswanensis]|uniref:uncharacterized protein n=1 Tax=Kwoniella botswanensis TaxID=1268659 RepID=UPI00315DF083
MPDPDCHPSHVSRPTSSSTSMSTAGGLRKRIVMNPPPSFIQYLASIAPHDAIPGANGPMMISSNGQAVLLSPNSASTGVHGSLQPSNDQSSTVDVDSTDNTPSADEGDMDDGQVVLKGDKVVLVAPTQTSSPTITPTSTPTVIEMVSSVVDSTGMASSAITSAPTATLASSSFSMTGSTSAAFTVTSTLATTSNDISLRTTSTAISTISTSSTSPSQSSTDKSSPTSDHHPPSAGIIFLIILLCLAIFIALASLLRYMVKSRRLPCLGRSRSDEDDDGLSDLVRGFDTPRTLGGGGYNPYLHASTYPHLSDVDDNQEKSELERRASLFAHQSTTNANGRSPFLHTESQSNSPIGYDGNMDIPNLPIPPPTAHSMGTSTLPHHLLGETGPLEVRNAGPGEMDEHENAHKHEHEHAQDEREVEGIDGLVGLGLGQGSPRFLGVNGNGLPVPWSTPLPPRPSSIDSFDNHQTNLHPNPFGSSSTLSAAQAPPLGFPSPSLSHDSLSLPQRSATWASNLRNTLYNAISAARVPTVGSNAVGHPGMGDEDKFTRTVSVGNIYRNASSRRKAIPSFDLEKGLKVVDEKDDIDDRMKSDDSSSTLVIPRKPAGERFKGYYSRSKSSMTTTSSSIDGDGGDEVEETRPPTRMAGGARAAGARTGSFVIV